MGNPAVTADSTGGTVASVRELRFRLGLTLAAGERYAEAVEEFTKARSEPGAEPDDAEILFRSAQAQEAVGDVESAFHAYLEAATATRARFDELLPFAHALLTRRTASAHGDWVRGEWAKRVRSRGLGPTEVGHLEFFVGRVDLYRGEYADALERFSRAKEVLPDDAQVSEGLAEALWRNGRLEKALTEFRRAYNLVQDSGPADRLVPIESKMVGVLTDAGEYREALERIDDILARDSRFAYELLIARARGCLALGDSRRALEASDAAIGQRSVTALARLWKVQALIALKQYPEAADEANEALLHDPMNPLIPFCKAQALIEGQLDIEQARQILPRGEMADGDSIGPKGQDGDHDPSPPAMRAAFVAREQDGDLHLFFAEVYLARGDRDRALEEVDRALEFGLNAGRAYPEAAAHRLRGELLADTGHRDEAASALYEAGRAYNWREDFASSLRVLDWSKKLAPPPPLLHFYRSDDLWGLSRSTTYPFVREHHRLEEALAAWEEGYALGSRGPEEAWAYLTHANILEFKGRLVEDFEQLWWDALLDTEKALLFLSDNSMALGNNARYARFVGLYATARSSLEKALGAHDDDFLLSERATMLAILGDPESVEAVDRYRARLPEPDVWADTLRAYALNIQGRFEEAATCLVRLDDRQLNPWPHSVRGRAYRLSGKDDLADQDFARVWNLTALEVIPQDLIHRALAGYELGHLEEASSLLEEVRGRSVADRAEALTALVICYLRMGRVAAAEAYLPAAIASLQTPTDVIVTLQDLDILERRQPEVAPAVTEVIGRFRMQLRDALSAIKERLGDGAVERELHALLTVRAGPDDIRFTVVRAIIARTDLEAGAYEDAVAGYRRLLEEHEERDAIRFPEARTGLANALEQLASAQHERLDVKGVVESQRALVALDPSRAFEADVAIASVQESAGCLDDALDSLRRASALATEPAEQVRARMLTGDLLWRSGHIGHAAQDYQSGLLLARTLQDLAAEAAFAARLGISAAVRGKGSEAAHWLRESLRAAIREGPWSDPVSHIRDVLLSFAGAVRAMDIYHGIVGALRALETDPEIADGARGGVRATRFEFIRRAYRHLRRPDDPAGVYDPWSLIPVPLPIRVEADAGWFPEGEDTPLVVWLINEAIPNLRDRIKASMGTTVPGVRIKADESLDQNFYVLSIDEVRLASGYVGPDDRYCADAEACRRAGIDGRACTNPWDGTEGMWISESSWSQAEAAGLELCKPYAFLLRHLESLIRRHLTAFLGLQEIDNLLRDWAGANDNRQALLARALSDVTARARLTHVLQGLVSESVPVSDLDTILAAFAGLAPGTDVKAAIEELRRVLSADVPIGEGRSLFGLSARAEALLARGVDAAHGGGASVPIDTRSAILSAIRDGLGDMVPRAALVVRTPGLRPVVRSLTANVFPSLAVLAANEVGKHRRIGAVLDLAEESELLTPRSNA